MRFFCDLININILCDRSIDLIILLFFQVSAKEDFNFVADGDPFPGHRFGCQKEGPRAQASTLGER
ncbi:hypothetical protein CEXT_122871, partial [Caerostris extrusa]